VNAYSDFLARKAIVDPATGFEPGPLPDPLFGFQRDVTAWALRRGRAALFAGTGLGKSLMELAWDEAVAAETRRPILQLAPLAVSAQFVREARKFGLDARLVDDADPGPGIRILNYQKLHHCDVGKLGGMSLDESSILKSTDGHYRTKLIEAAQAIPYRLAATATPAPNDFVELGNHAEFLGIMSYTDMLATFFVHDGGDTRSWRLKGHAEDDFWKWMASWAVMLRKPSDLGYSDDGYELPPLHYHLHRVAAAQSAPTINNSLGLTLPAETLQERISARRDTVAERVAMAASVTSRDRPFVWWCNLNSEAEGMARALSGSVNLTGSMSDDDKENVILRFIAGEIGTLITKPTICGFGLNFQHCADTGFVGLNDSWEQFYQAVRRFWRFGQLRPVNCHIVAAETEGATVANIRRKEADADRMAAAMVRHMADLSAAAVRGAMRDRPNYSPAQAMQIPEWLEAA
jgi:hypothetical protein